MQISMNFANICAKCCVRQQVKFVIKFELDATISNNTLHDAILIAKQNHKVLHIRDR